jgi:adenylosuccinate lyase
VLPGAIRRNLEHHLPFLASERLLMAATTSGGDRQELHEAIRLHSHATTARMREGHDNDLIERLAADPLFAGIDLIQAMDVPGLAGRAAAQVEEFITGPVREALATCPTRAAESALRV